MIIFKYFKYHTIIKEIIVLLNYSNNQKNNFIIFYTIRIK